MIYIHILWNISVYKHADNSGQKKGKSVLAMQMKLLRYSFSLALRITSVFYSWSIFRVGSGDLGNQKIYIYGSLYFNFLKSSNILIYSPLKLIYRNLIESLAGSKECASNMSVLCLLTQSYPSLCNPMDCSPPGTSVHGDSPGKNTEVSCHVLLQGIFPTQGSNQHLLCLQHW